MLRMGHTMYWYVLLTNKTERETVNEISDFRPNQLKILSGFLLMTGWTKLPG